MALSRLRVICVIILYFIASAMARFGQSFPEFKNPEMIKQLSVSQNNFSRDLYLALIKETEGNLFFSPFSIMTALSMAHMGTGGNTAQQIDKVMHLTQDKSEIKTAFKEIVADFKRDVQEYELNTSNMMYVSHNLTVLEEFSNSLKEYFLSSSKTVDFSQSEAVRNEINTIVEQETKNKIKELIKPGIIDASTAMVLVNAVYFKGLWNHQFKEVNTIEEDFYVTPSQKVKVPMMHIEEKFRWASLKHLNANLLALDYKGGRLSMIIVLPDAKDGLADLEAKMATEDLLEWDRRTASVKVQVSLPKFKLEQTFSLPNLLAKMGITDLFNPQHCDLSGINGGKDLFVSAVVHKSFIEVNEEGSEAAAATVMAMNRMALIRQPGPFIIDHPFLFFIRDRHSQVTLFTGRYVTPNNCLQKDEL